MSRRRKGASLSLATLRGVRLGLAAAVAWAVFAPTRAWAASLSGPVSGWSSGVPSYISMYEYVPDELAASPPVVVAAHYCNGSASAFFGYAGMPALVAAADQYGFILIFPQTTNANSSSRNCWDVGSKASLTHDGGGDTHAIAQMVQYQLDTRNADPARVYVMGASSGAMMTQALLAVYPEVFKAGSEFSGVPAGCWASGYSAASNWSEACAKGMVTMTGPAWGALVQQMNPGYSGYRPRIQLWHGTSDTTIDFANQTEAIKQWTNVLGLSATPNATEMPSGYEVEKWQNACGFTVLEAHTQTGGGHTTPIDANAVVSFFGLDKTGPDPQSAACGPSGNGGSGGTAGSSGNLAGNGGTPGGAAGSTASNSGGTLGGIGGSRAGGSAGMTGGIGGASAGNSGATAAGIAGAIAGGSGGRGTLDAGSGGMLVSGSGGRVTAGGTGGTGNGGGASGASVGGASTTGGGPPTDEDTSGCGCRVGTGRHSRGALGALTLAALGVLLARRARRRRLATETPVNTVICS